MKKYPVILWIVLIAGFSVLGVSAQQDSRERREQAYAKLLEGQRNFWRMKRTNSDSARRIFERDAKNAFQKAVELNPSLAEGYTALAELLLSKDGVTREQVDEAVTLSKIAVKLDPDNFGSHRYLARIYTARSGVGGNRIDPVLAAKAIEEWRHLVRMDPRNAEAWAFLAAFYKKTDETKKRLEALRKWVAASSSSSESGFYSSIMRVEGGGLSAEKAATKLGAALLEAGENDEALEVLTRAVSDRPKNSAALDLLERALENAEGKSLISAISALRQAVYANPDNQGLVHLLAETIVKSGEVDSAVRVLSSAVEKAVGKNRYSASKYQLAIGDIFAESNRTDEAMAAYRKALSIRGIKNGETAPDDDLDFAKRVIDRMVRALRRANRGAEAERLLQDSKLLWGKNTVDLDKQRIDLLFSIGKKKEALQTVRLARKKSPYDVGLLRKEALILVELGRVDEGTKIIKDVISSTNAGSVARSLGTPFSNYLYLASLYTTAKREVEGTRAINQAITLADSKENLLIAKLNLAFLQQSFGRFEDAEKNLRLILKESPRYPIALNNLGYLLVKRGKNLDEALELIKRAVQIEPKNASYLDSLGWVYFKLERLEEAERYLRRANRLNSTSPAILEHLGDVYRKSGRIAEAKEVWQKALMFVSDKTETERIRIKLTK